MRSGILLMVLFLSFSAVSVYGSNTGTKKRLVNEQIVVLNLVEGIESGNCGLCCCSAVLLGEIGSTDAVIPLMKLFHSDCKTELRIAAAQSLAKIGDPRGLKLLEYASQYDNDPRVKRFAEIFYRASLAGLIES